jgi:D-amino peptidase
MTKYIPRLFLLFIVISGLAVGAQTPAPRPLKVLILYDMEGISEATSPAHPKFGTEEYKQARVSLTADVNAAVAGLKAAGVSNIIVVDGHGSGNMSSPDILEDGLMAPARMISRDAPFDIYMDSYDRSFDAIVAIAMHAGAGNATGFLSHTYSGRGIGYTVNGEPFNETMIMAMGSGRFNIPMVAVSGDDELEKEIRRHLPWAGYATVKHAVDRSSAVPLARPEIDRRITEAVAAGIRKLGEARLFQKPGPYRFSVTFASEDAARDAAQRAGSEFVCEGATVRVDSADFVEGYRKSIRLFGSGVTAAPAPQPASSPLRFWGARSPLAPRN